MSISVYVDTRRKVQNVANPVKLYINHKGGKFLINTGLTTIKPFSGLEFPESEYEAREKSRKLNKIYWAVDEVCEAYKKATPKELRMIIMKEVFGKDFVTHTPTTFIEYIDMYARDMKPSTRKLYSLTADRIREYDAGVTLLLIDKTWLEGFDRFLRSEKGLSTNGIAQKMRNIRAVMNWCRDEGIQMPYPFRGRNGYKIRQEESVPNNLTAQEFADLRDYPCEPWQKVYVDMFCLSTYLGGVNVGDMLLCEGLTNGRFVYVRRKTDKSNSNITRKISIPVSPQAMDIIERYKGNKYLLNIMDRIGDYHTFTQHWNKALKKIGPSRIVPDKVGKLRKIDYEPLFPNITSYSARYTFASIAANDLDISEATIGRCLGHSWAMNGKQVTARYISHDQRKVDNAILRVAEYLSTFKGRYKE